MDNWNWSEEKTLKFLADKFGDDFEIKEDLDSSLDPYEDRITILKYVYKLLKKERRADVKDIKSFLQLHIEDILNTGTDEAILDEFDQFKSVNESRDPSVFLKGKSEDYAYEMLDKAEDNDDPNMAKSIRKYINKTFKGIKESNTLNLSDTL